MTLMDRMLGRPPKKVLTFSVPSNDWPELLPPDLVEWFPICRIAAIGGNIYCIAVASCARCGAAVALYDQGDFAHLYRHVEYHQLHTK